jgi:hypothetical protein
LFVLILNPFTAYADEPLDEIEKYEITINAREDGTLDIRYAVDWKVLSDKNGKEPVTWVDVGIPNKHVDQIAGLTDNIKTIGYSNKGGGDLVRLDFTQAYKAGEVFHFEFSIHQSYMYMLDEDEVCRYSFTPGWFDKIQIKVLHILWSNKYVVSSDATHKGEDFLEWYRTDMKAGEHFKINVRYHRSTFYVDENKQYSEPGMDVGTIIFLVFLAIIVIIIVVAVVAEYECGSGFGGGFYSSGGGGCASSSSCACACACAGGGRAGCSAKTWYSINHLEEVCLKHTPWYKKVFKKFISALK